MCFSTGEEIHVMMYGAAVDANVRLDKNTLRIDNTYIFMANQRSVVIHNRSEVLAHYKWSPFATQIEEDSQKQRYVFCEKQKQRNMLLETFIICVV